MTEPGVCDGCRQADTCKEVYRELDSMEGPCLVREVLVAFLLPLVIFVAALAGFGYLLRGAIARPYHTPATLVLALLTTAALMLAGRALARRRHKG